MLNSNQQLQFIDIANDIAGKENKEIHEILAESKFELPKMNKML